MIRQVSLQEEEIRIETHQGHTCTEDGHVKRNPEMREENITHLTSHCSSLPSASKGHTEQRDLAGPGLGEGLPENRPLN